MVVSDMEAQWHAKLQGQSFSVEEMIERGMLYAGDNFGADSQASSSPACSRSPRKHPLATVSLACRHKALPGVTGQSARVPPLGLPGGLASQACCCIAVLPDLCC